MSITLSDLSVTFKNKVTAVNHVDLEITKGVYGLLGENGAGKTTLMRVLTTVLKQTSGKAMINDVCYEENNYEKIQRKIGYLPQEINLYPDLSVQECLEYLAELTGIKKAVYKGRIEGYLKRTGMTEHKNKKMKQLSGGMKRRVGLVQALLNEPDFLIIDEPTTGLDPEERIRIRNLLVDFSEGRTVLFSTHIVEDLAATCNKLAIMKKGSFIYNGSLSNLLNKTKGCTWICRAKDESEARRIEKEHCVSGKQYVDGGLQMRLLSDKKPALECISSETTLEDAYIYLTNK